MLIKEYKLYMAKKLIRLTESDLHRIIKESVNRILNENESYVDMLRRQNAEKKASWDSFENTVPYLDNGNLPTELDSKFSYDSNKFHHKYIQDKRPEKNGFSTYSNFAKDSDYFLKGFNAMQALDDESNDFYRDGKFWNGME